MTQINEDIILMGTNAQDKLFAGMKKLAEPVIQTLGPNGKTVILGLTLDSNEPVITKDGVSVANYIKLNDPVENIGCNLLKEAAQSLLKTVGDGTTTTTLLAYTLIKNYMQERDNFNKSDIQKIANEILTAVNSVQPLDLNADTLKSLISNVSNNDQTLTDFVYNLVTNYPTHLLRIEDGIEDTDTFVVQNGYYLRTNLMSSTFFTSTRSVELPEAEILLIDDKVEKIAQVKDTISNHFAQSKLPLIIIAHEFSMDVIKTFAENWLKGFKIYPVQIEGTSQTRSGYLEDIAVVLDCKVYSLKTLKEAESVILGSVKDVNHHSNSFSFTPFKTQEIEVSNLQNKLKELINLSKVESDRKYLQERLNKLNGGMITIYVGGSTTSARKERYDRYDDVIRAIDVAKTNGIVQGGGLTALNLVQEGQYFITQALFATAYNILSEGMSDVDYRKQIEGKVFDSYKGFIEGYKVSVELFLLFASIGCVTINE